MRWIPRERALILQTSYQTDERANEWLADSMGEMERRTMRTTLQIREVVEEGGHHFFPSIDEMIAGRGCYVQPQSRDELALCRGEYSSKLHQLGTTATPGRTCAAVAPAPSDLSHTGSGNGTDALSESFYAMRRALRDANPLGSSTVLAKDMFREGV